MALHGLGLILALLAVSTLGCARDNASPQALEHARFYEGALAPDVAGFVGQLAERMPGRLEGHGAPGASIALVADGHLVWAGGYGWADARRKRPVFPDTPFAVHSLSKPVTAWGVMRLVEQGRLDLDAPISQYLHSWRLPPSEFDARQVTARRLLSHTAGISSASIQPKAGSRARSVMVSLDGQTLCVPCATQELGHPPNAFIERPPGTFQYSHHNYSILQLAIEDITGDTFAAFMRDEVLRPLGMQDADFEVTYDLAVAAAVGSGRGQDEWRVWTDPVQAAFGLTTSAEDLARFAAGHMPGSSGEVAGRGVISADSLTFVTASQPGTEGALLPWMPPADAYGLGYRLDTGPSGSLVVSSWDVFGAWASAVAMMPDKRNGIVVLTNTNATGLDLQREIVCDWLKWLDEAGEYCVRQFDVYVARADGAEVSRLTASPPGALGVGWAPDGRRIVYERTPVTGEQFTSLQTLGVDAALSERVPFTSDRPRSRYELSPTADRFAYMSWLRGDGQPHIFVAGSDGSAEVQLTTSRAADSTPTWSPDGRRVAFLRTSQPLERGDTTWELRTVSADGGAEDVLATVHFEVDFSDSFGISLLDWSPDGRRIAFSSQGDLYVVNVQDRSVQRLTQDAAKNRDPSWSPDGAQLVFASKADGQYDLFTMTADGSRRTPLVSGPADELAPHWSPDGTRIAFLSNREPERPAR